MVAFLVLGLIVGVLARLLRGGLRDPGVSVTVAAGVVGALVGGLLTNAVLSRPVGDLAPASIAGAIVLCLVAVGVVESRDWASPPADPTS